MIYTVTLNPAIDHILRLPRPVALGRTNRAHWEDFLPGGKGINVSRILNVLGMDNIALGFVAGTTGRWLEQSVQEAGVDTQFLHLRTGMTRINTKIKMSSELVADQSVETEINGKGPTVPHESVMELFRMLDDLEPEDVLVLSGSLPAGMGPAMYARMIERVQEQEVPVVVDTSGQALLEVLPMRPYLIKPNVEELSLLVGRRLESLEQVTAAARQVQQQGARNVLVSMGRSGALLMTEKGRAMRQEAPEGKAIDTVGAGDSMVAGFLAGYITTGDYRKALRLGVAAGSATAFRIGLAEREDITAALARTPE